MESLKKLLGARIKELRKLNKLSQEQLSEKIDIDPKHLSRIEVGNSYPSLDTLESIANALKVEIKDFFEFHPRKTHKELRDSITALLKYADEKKSDKILKIIRVLLA
jgi:transcriptional regulator with XRE-family HTH domain